MSITVSKAPPPEAQLGAAELFPVTDGHGRVVDFTVAALAPAGDAAEGSQPRLLTDIVEPDGLTPLLERLVAAQTTEPVDLLLLEVDGEPYLVRLSPRHDRLLAVWSDCRPREIAPAQVTIDLSDRDRTWLSRREVDILALVAEGATTREIAERLYLSVHTIRNHVRRILTKLGARSRSEAVATALANHLIELPTAPLPERGTRPVGARPPVQPSP